MPELEVEMERAIGIHGLQADKQLSEQFVVLSEEIGEIAKAILENDIENLQEEIVQSIAMLVKLYWLAKER